MSLDGFIAGPNPAPDNPLGVRRKHPLGGALLEGGTNLFGELGENIQLEKVSVRDEEDVTHLAYRPKRKQ